MPPLIFIDARPRADARGRAARSAGRAPRAAPAQAHAVVGDDHGGRGAALLRRSIKNGLAWAEYVSHPARMLGLLALQKWATAKRR